MASAPDDERYRDSLVHLIRAMAGVARALKGFREASESNPREAAPPTIDMFPPTGLRETDAVANMFTVTYRLLSRHVERLRALLGEGHPAPTGKARATVLVCGLDERAAEYVEEDPPVVLETLARYGTLMATVMSRHGGEFVMRDDASVLAVFGDGPGAGERGALRACRAGLATLAALDQFNSYRARRDMPPLRCSLGIHTGDVVSGTITSPGVRSSVTVGPAVAGAQAAQREATDEVRPLLISETTANEAGSDVAVERLKDRSVRVGELTVPLFSIVQMPPHVDYRALLDEMFGVLPLPPEEVDGGTSQTALARSVESER